MLTVLLEYNQNGDRSIRVYRSFSLTCNLTGKDFRYKYRKSLPVIPKIIIITRLITRLPKIIIPIMLALCLLYSGTYYDKNCVGIIGRDLFPYSFSATRVYSPCHYHILSSDNKNTVIAGVGTG